MTKWRRISSGMLCTLAGFLPTIGCGKEEPTRPQAGSANSVGKGTPGKSSTSSIGPDTSPIRPTLELGWCTGHGVPESVCTRCNASLIPVFTEAGDWCVEHGLPESQCTNCNPEVAAKWARLNPTDSSGTPASALVAVESTGPGPGPTSSAIEPTGELGWCAGHGVPESVCTRCNGSLIATFKEAGDWCEVHDLPESQCTVCHPQVDAEWAKLEPEAATALNEGDTGVRVERATRLLTGTNDPVCQVENLRVRFIDPSIVRKAGIQVERVERRTMSATIEVPAEVEFDATRSARITPRLAGIVREVPVNVGSVVETGDLLAIVDSPVLGEAKSQYIELTQTLKLAGTDLNRVNIITRGVKQMLEVCTPEASAKEIRETLVESPIGDAKAKMLRAHATLQLARAEAARQATLLDKKVSSERDFQAAQSVLAAAEADFIAIREEIAFSVERERLVAERGMEVARSALDVAQRKLHILGLTEEQVDRIGSEPNELLSRFELRSPVAGRVIERKVAVGESVEANHVLFVVVDTSTMWLMADLYERNLFQVRAGLSVIFTVDGMPGVSFEGKVSWISSQVDDRTRTIRLRADLPNEDGLLRAKMFGRARIVIHENGQVVTVPIGAVQTDGCCQLVFVRESDTLFQPRKIVLGASANGFVEVLRGLQEGETVVSTGSFLMKTEILKSNIGAGCCDVDQGR